MERRIGGRRRVAPAGIAVAVAAILGLEAAVASPGANFVVNSTRDAVDVLAGDGACVTSAGTCTLRAAIQEANAHPGADAIHVPAGAYRIAIPPLNQNDVTTGDLDITDSVTIGGAGAGTTIVDGGVPAPGSPPQVPGLDRVFEVAIDGGTVEFAGLTLSHGYAAEYGGAIANNSTATITVSGSVLSGNVAGKTGGAIDNHLGGAVHVWNSTVSGNFANESGSAINNNRDGALTVTDSIVSSNSAVTVGLDEALAGAGAISNNAELDASGTIEVTRSRVFANRAGGGRSGATISNDGTGTISVDQTTFSDNIATGDGGAIFNGAGEVTVSGSTFAENAARDGGAVYNDGRSGGVVTVSDSSFSLNTASARGGAIASSGTGFLTVRDGSFDRNGAGDWGGAVVNDDKGSATILNSSFRENSGLNGGGFANEGTGPVSVRESTFTENSASAGALLDGGEGGGIHSSSVGEVVLSGGAFTGNTARSGGGLSNDGGGTLEISRTRFSANRADEQGGGLLIQSGAVRIVDVDVTGNTADSVLEGGGGISYQGDKVVGDGESAAIQDSRIRDNISHGDGGGIDSRGDGPLAITTTAITGNAAATGGGIHHVGDAPLEVTRTTLSGNVADSGGAVFSDGDGEAAVENSTVSGNRAIRFGGGLLVSSRVTLRNSTVADNSGASGGGINNGGGDLVGDGSVFLANTIVANNPTGGNCLGSMTSLGGNVENADSCRFRELSDQPGTAPRLGPLAENGGPTQTHALLAGSPAQEQAVCTELDPCPPIDQRGVARPQFDDFDAGAYESETTPGGSGGQPCAGRIERPVQAVADSWVSQAAPSANFGNDATLKAASKLGGNERALVHFALPLVPPGCKLVGARLRLHSSAATDGRTLEARRVVSAWGELGVTWANQPAAAGPAATTDSGLGTREWDVLAQTLELYALGNHGFLIRDAFENDRGEQAFHGTEKAELPPELVLVFDDPDNPPPPGTCPTNPQSLSADQDSWVSEGSPASNAGADSSLKIKSQAGSNSRALFRFPLPALPAGCTGIASASLRVQAASAKEGRTLEVRQVASGWTETGVTWANQPAATGPAATVASAQGPLEWSVTPQVRAMYTSANYGLLIRDAQENGVGDEQTLHSREKLDDDPPELVVVFEDRMPETTIDSGPTSPTRATIAEFTFSSDQADATFECSLDGALFAACRSPHPVSGLAEGDHSFEVRATRGVSAVDPTPARYEWKVIPTPETTIAGPASPSASRIATLTFAADDPDATFECSLDGAPFTPCASPVEYSGLPDGEHELRVRATDGFGNVEPTPASHVWAVDTTAPVTTITDGPDALTKLTTASFTFTADEPATFECALDSDMFSECRTEYAGLTDGQHRLQVRATDAAGNTDATPASYSWTVDTTAPVTTITDGPDALTKLTTASFTFTANEPATFECALDTDTFSACRTEYTDLPDGQHHLQVRATDSAGNTDATPASYSWTVDATAPVTTIAGGPSSPSNETTASFTFTADEPASFECALDNDVFSECRTEYTGLADGQHRFQVRATDAASATPTRPRRPTAGPSTPRHRSRRSPADRRAQATRRLRALRSPPTSPRRLSARSTATCSPSAGPNTPASLTASTASKSARPTVSATPTRPRRPTAGRSTRPRRRRRSATHRR